MPFVLVPDFTNVVYSFGIVSPFSLSLCLSKSSGLSQSISPQEVFSVSRGKADCYLCVLAQHTELYLSSYCSVLQLPIYLSVSLSVASVQLRQELWLLCSRLYFQHLALFLRYIISDLGQII